MTPGDGAEECLNIVLNRIFPVFIMQDCNCKYKMYNKSGNKCA